MSVGDIVRAVIQIAILTFLLFNLYRIFKGTRSAQMLFGVVFVFGGLAFVTWLLRLDVLAVILGKLFLGIAAALVVIFQPELRQAFQTIGRHSLSLKAEEVKDRVVDTVCAVAETLSMHRHGAIMAIERNSALKEWVKTGTALGAPMVGELLTSIFFPNSTLHDGAVIIKGETIVAARCVLPLTEVDVGRGTRHRAAVGLSERSDAVVVVISEETGSISIAVGGKLKTGLTRETLSKHLMLLLRKEDISSTIKRTISGMDAGKEAKDASGSETAETRPTEQSVVAESAESAGEEASHEV